MSACLCDGERRQRACVCVVLSVCVTYQWPCLAWRACIIDALPIKAPSQGILWGPGATRSSHLNGRPSLRPLLTACRLKAAHEGSRRKRIHQWWGHGAGRIMALTFSLAACRRAGEDSRVFCWGWGWGWGWGAGGPLTARSQHRRCAESHSWGPDE